VRGQVVCVSLVEQEKEVFVEFVVSSVTSSFKLRGSEILK
jgi:hypothetical protein